MRVTRLDIPKNIEKNLKPIKMDNLAKFVVLAGRNGAGKTRILDEIKLYIDSYVTDDEKTALETQLAQKRAALSQLPAAKDGSSDPYASTKNTIKSGMGNIKTQLKYMEFIHVESPVEGLKSIHYLPNDLHFACPRQLTAEEVHNRAALIDGLDSMVAIGKSAYSRIQALQDRDVNVRYHGFSGTSDEKGKAIEEYNTLRDVVIELLGQDARIERNMSGAATIFGRPLGESGLSDGQKVLLSMAVSLHAQGTRLAEAILILDEPENHLHPAALTEVFDRLSESVSRGQIWVATHSVPLLSRFAPSDIWYVEDGRVMKGGPQMMSVLTSLIGTEDNISKIHSFLDLPAYYTMNKFSYECMFSPRAIMTGKEDEQMQQIDATIRQLRAEGKKLKVLDYGAGVGRLPAFIAEMHLDAPEWLDYKAYDKYPNDQVNCESNVTKIYGKCDGRYLNTLHDLASDDQGWRADIVIMTNVLHEIPPCEWLSEFSALTSHIDDDGYLLVVEDQLLGKGEKAYKTGFLVLDTQHLGKLFEVPEGDDAALRVAKESDNHRLKAHLIKKSLIHNISEKTIVSTLKAVGETAIHEVQRLRGEVPSHINGRLMAFWLQQYATSQLELMTRERRQGNDKLLSLQGVSTTEREIGLGCQHVSYPTG